MHSSSKRIAILGIALALASGAAFAQDKPEAAAQAATPVVATVPVDQQPTRAQLDNLFEVMRVRQQLAAMSKTMPKLMQDTITQQFEQTQKDHPEMQTMTPAQSKASAQILGKYMERVMNLYTADEMMDDMASLYQKHLSSSDVDQLIGFYSSPAGQHALDMIPAITQEFMPLVQKKVTDRIQPAIEQMSKEMEDLMKPPADESAPAKN